MEQKGEQKGNKNKNRNNCNMEADSSNNKKEGRKNNNNRTQRHLTNQVRHLTSQALIVERSTTVKLFELQRHQPWLLVMITSWWLGGIHIPLHKGSWGATRSLTTKWDCTDTWRVNYALNSNGGFGCYCCWLFLLVGLVVGSLCCFLLYFLLSSLISEDGTPFRQVQTCKPLLLVNDPWICTVGYYHYWFLIATIGY